MVSDHKDIVPSLIDYLGLPENYSPLHNSVFNTKERRRVVWKMANTFSLLEDDRLGEYHCKSQNFALWRMKESGEKIRIKDKFLIKKYRGLLQTYLKYGLRKG